MLRLCAHVVMGLFVAVAAAAQDLAKTSELQYQVLNPWAEVDPIPLKGISPRIDSFSGKKIGLFANYKRAAVPIAESLRVKLEAGYPDADISLYHSDQWNVIEAETENREQFMEWAKGMDAVILAVGD